MSSRFSYESSSEADLSRLVEDTAHLRQWYHFSSDTRILIRRTDPAIIIESALTLSESRRGNLTISLRFKGSKDDLAHTLKLTSFSPSANHLCLGLQHDDQKYFLIQPWHSGEKEYPSRERKHFENHDPFLSCGFRETDGEYPVEQMIIDLYHPSLSYTSKLPNDIFLQFRNDDFFKTSRQDL